MTPEEIDLIRDGIYAVVFCFFLWLIFTKM